MADGALVKFGGVGIDWNGNPGFLNFALNGSTDQFEFTFQAEESGPLTRLGVRLGAKTGTTPTYKISLQGVDGSGLPDGTIKGGGSPCSKTFNPSSLGWADGSWNWLTLDNPYTMTRGELLAGVIAYDSGTIDGSNNASFSAHNNTGPNFLFPRVFQNDAGSRTLTSSMPYFGYGTATRAFGTPIQTAGSATVNSGSTPDEVGMLFTLPSAWSGTKQIVKVRVGMYVNSGQSILWQLYDSDGSTVLQNVTTDTDTPRTGVYGWHEYTFDEETLATLKFGSSYRLTMAPQAVTSHFPSYIEVASAADFDAWEGGQNIQWTERTNGGAWTDRPTRRPLMDFELKDLSKGGPFLVRRKFYSFPRNTRRVKRPVLANVQQVNQSVVVARRRRVL